MASVFLTGIDAVTFHRDESQWINFSEYFELAAGADIHSPAWGVSYATVTQPPVARYVIGMARRFGGYTVDELNKPWNFHRSDEANHAEGRMPPPSLLWWSRLPMALLAVASGLILVRCARMLSGRLAGYVILTLFAITPFYSTHLRRAMGESLMLFWMMLTVLAGLKLVASWRRVLRADVRGLDSDRGAMWRPLVWTIVLGVISGLAGATKLNGLTLMGVGGGLCAFLAWKSSRVPSRRRLQLLAFGALLLPATTGAVFLAVNPFLYSHPRYHLTLMLDHRASQIRQQQANAPSAALPLDDVAKRLAVVPRRILRESSPSERRDVTALIGIFAMAGLVLLLSRAVQWARTDAETGVGVVLVLLALVTVIPAVMTPLNWDRYYLPPVLFSTLCVSIAASSILEWSAVRLKTVIARGSAA